MGQRTTREIGPRFSRLLLRLRIFFQDRMRHRSGIESASLRKVDNDGDLRLLRGRITYKNAVGSCAAGGRRRARLSGHFQPFHVSSMRRAISDRVLQTVKYGLVGRNIAASLSHREPTISGKQLDRRDLDSALA